MVASQLALIVVLTLAGSSFSLAAPLESSVAAVTQAWIPPPAPVHPEGNAAGPPEIRLAVAGDVGTGGSSEWATAGLMAVADEAADFDALVLLGDNVYPHGDPGRLQKTVFDPFASVLDGHTGLIGVLGNHDVENNNAKGQLAALGMAGRWYSVTIGNTLIVVLDSTLPDSKSQAAFVKEALAGSNATWKIVALHHPPYSAGAHGSNLRTREAFAGVFADYGVDLVLAGHDHDYQRSHPIDGVVYVVSGGAARLRPVGTAAFTAFSASTLHFVTVDIWGDLLVMTAHSASGVVDRVVLQAS